MTDHYEDVDEQKERVLKNTQVLGFIARFWMRRRWLMAATTLLTITSVGFDLAVPWTAGNLEDAIADRGLAGTAWRAWAFFVGVYLCALVTRNLAMRWFWIPLAANNMKELIDEAFRKVQSFSSDWHADNFAGA